MSRYTLEKSNAAGGTDRAVVMVYRHVKDGRHSFKLKVDAKHPYKAGEAIGRPFEVFTMAKDHIRYLEGLGMEIVEKDEGWWPEENEDSDLVDVRLALPENGEHVLVWAEPYFDMAAYRDGHFHFLSDTTPAGLVVTRWARGRRK